MTYSNLGTLWKKLSADAKFRENFIDGVHLRGFNGIADLRVEFSYPVSVLIGENGVGKSTILFAICDACTNGGKRQDLPLLHFQSGASIDFDKPSIEKSYFIHGRDKGESIGVKCVSITQERREEGETTLRSVRETESYRSETLFDRSCALHTYSNFKEFEGKVDKEKFPNLPCEEALTKRQRSMFDGILPQFKGWEYEWFLSEKGNLWGATTPAESFYNEVAMAGGERALLRMLRRIGGARNAVLLIDDIETALHPKAQQELMVRIQEQALEHNNQVFVTSHSPTVANCVPPEGRILLARLPDDRVVARPAYPDIVHYLLCGQPSDYFRVVCEDDAAIGILEGVIGRIWRMHDWPFASIKVMKVGGAGIVSQAARSVREVGELDAYLFVLDGDQHCERPGRKLFECAPNHSMLLPDETPETIVYGETKNYPADIAKALDVPVEQITKIASQSELVPPGRERTRKSIGKELVSRMCKEFNITERYICRRIAESACARDTDDWSRVSVTIERSIERWRRAMELS